MARPSATRCRWPPESSLGLRSSSFSSCEDARGVVDALLDLGLGDLAQLEAEREVVADRHVRVERVALEHHRDVAVLGGDVVDDLVADPQRAVGDLLEPGDHPQARRLAAARRPDEHHELAVADLEVEVRHGGHVAVLLEHVIERHGRHGQPPARLSRSSRAHASGRRTSDGLGRAPYEVLAVGLRASYGTVAGGAMTAGHCKRVGDRPATYRCRHERPPARRPARAPVRPRRRRRAGRRVLRRPVPTRRTRRSGSRSGPPATAARRSGRAFNEAHILATTEAICRYRACAGLRRARCSSAATRTRCPSPRARTALEVLVANGVDVRVDAADGYTPDAGRLARDPRRQPRPRGRRAASPTGSSSRRRTTRPRTAASSTTRPTAARPTPTSRAGSRTRRTGSSRRRARRPRRHRPRAVRARARVGRVAHDFLGTYVEDLGNVVDMDAIAAVGAPDRRRPAGRRGGRLLGRDRRALRPRPHGHQPGRRPDLRLHDRSTGTARSGWTRRRRTRWPGWSRCATGSTSPSATTPTPTGTAIVIPGAGLMNPNHFLAAAISYLFGGARGVGRGRRRRQDARVVLDHRPRRGRPRPAAGRGPGRLQVVRRRPRRRLDRVRRRGERRGLVPAPRRHGLDDRQGRDHRRACSRRS